MTNLLIILIIATLLLLTLSLIFQYFYFEKITRGMKQKKNNIYKNNIIPLSNKDINPIKDNPIADEKNLDINKITFLQDNSSDKIVFSKIPSTSVSLKDYTIVPTSTSTITGSAMQLTPLLNQLATKGVFESSVHPSFLTTFSNGSFSTMIQGSNGQIIQHAGFNSATAKIATPLVVFQVFSFATGLYYLNIINKNFQSLSNKIDDLKRFLEQDKLSELENIQIQLERLVNIEYPLLEHLFLIETLKDKIGHLIRYYINEVRHIGKNIQIEKRTFTHTQIKSLEQNIGRDNFLFNIQMLATAEEMKEISNLVSLTLNSKYMNLEPSMARKKHIQLLIEEILNWNSNSSFINKEGKSIAKNYYNSIQQAIEKKNPWFNSGKEKKKYFEEKIKELKQNISALGKFSLSTKFQKELKKFLEEKEDILLLYNQEEPIFLLKNKK